MNLFPMTDSNEDSKITALSIDFLLARKICCGSSCLNCPYISADGNRHQKGSTNINNLWIEKDKNTTNE